VPFFNNLWSSPIQIVICIYMLWQYLGIAAIAGNSSFLTYLF
jgi:hypothetical protein